MSTQSQALNRLGIAFRQVPGWRWQLAIALPAYLVVTYLILRAYPDLEVQFRFSFAPFLDASPVVQIHVAAALAALGVGSLLMLGRKGVKYHKVMGWLWVGAMAVTAVSSFFLVGLMGDSFSPIHALSAWVLIVLPRGYQAARGKDIRRHSSRMGGMFVGAILIAGLFAFLPGRLMWSLFFAA